ncbi:MAG TPA: DNA breaking-rejoining protein [Ignavibacteria bacterium]|nr:DNA breaking-rejoining protein [Ignavibacteria bacterium]HMR41979.1 DNA breaking-rejoining protein [Ignavibacteria bacterium]
MKTLKLTFVLLLFVTGVVFSQDIETKTIKFAKGSSGTTIKGSIKGDNTIDYILNAREGQILKVELTTNNSSNYFNLLNPDENDVAFYNSSMDGNSYEGVLTVSGDHKIRVYLMRSAARREESAKFKLKVSVTD